VSQQNAEVAHDDPICAASATYDNGSIVCMDGTLFGPCENEYCAGECEPAGDCVCRCHKLGSSTVVE
jgi:hypothetical protein